MKEVFVVTTLILLSLPINDLSHPVHDGPEVNTVVSGRIPDGAGPVNGSYENSQFISGHLKTKQGINYSLSALLPVAKLQGDSFLISESIDIFSYGSSGYVDKVSLGLNISLGDRFFIFEGERIGSLFQNRFSDAFSIIFPSDTQEEFVTIALFVTFYIYKFGPTEPTPSDQWYRTPFIEMFRIRLYNPVKYDGPIIETPDNLTILDSVNVTLIWMIRDELNVRNVLRLNNTIIYEDYWNNPNQNYSIIKIMFDQHDEGVYFFELSSSNGLVTNVDYNLIRVISSSDHLTNNFQIQFTFIDLWGSVIIIYYLVRKRKIYL